MPFCLENQIFSVTEITQSIKNLLSQKFNTLSIKGEITNISLSSSGHLYFSLKDLNAKIQAVFFNFSLNKKDINPREGALVVVSGSLNVYPPNGSYQIIVRKLTITDNDGDLLLKKEEIKNKCLLKGYFDTERKKIIPSSPKKIGVITSSTGAVIQDIIKVLLRRLNSFSLVLYPVLVQGEDASKEISQAIRDLNHYKLTEVLIVARGGGSIEDLFPFNEEVVLEEIFKSSIPIISAIGHESDTTLADLVADLRAPTPSVAAELVAKETDWWIKTISSYEKRAFSYISNKFSLLKNKINFFRKNLEKKYLLKTSEQRLDFAKKNFSSAFLNYFQFIKIKIEKYKNFFSSQAFKRTFLSEKEKIRKIKQQLSFSYFSRKTQLINFLAHNKQIMSLKMNQTISEIKNKINFSKNRIIRLISLMLDTKKASLSYLFSSLQKNLCLLIEKMKQKIIFLKIQLSSLNPKNTLKRGYSIALDFNSRSVILSKNSLKPAQAISLVMCDGETKVFVSEDKPSNLGKIYGKK